MLTSEAVLGLLRAIEAGDVDIMAIDRPEDIFAGEVEYLVTSGACRGWRLWVFNDCMSWDYLDSVTTPSGEKLDFDDMTADLQNYRPSDARAAAIAYGIVP